MTTATCPYCHKPLGQSAVTMEIQVQHQSFTHTFCKRVCPACYRKHNQPATHKSRCPRHRALFNKAVLVDMGKHENTVLK